MYVIDVMIHAVFKEVTVHTQLAQPVTNYTSIVYLVASSKQVEGNRETP